MKFFLKKWQHHFSTREILPEDSPTSSQKLTFETNGKTLPPHTNNTLYSVETHKMSLNL